MAGAGMLSKLRTLRVCCLPIMAFLALLPGPLSFAAWSSRSFSKEAAQFLSRVAPRLDNELGHKGQGGRVAILGGSKDYTGAPYYAGLAALRTGAELVYVYTAEEAALPIKSYSPELMVTPIYSGTPQAADVVRAVSPNLGRLHSLVIGCGLGRHPGILEGAMALLRDAQKQGLPVVVDADGLQAVVDNPEALAGADRVVLTPNVAEFRRLLSAVGVESEAAPLKDQLRQLVDKLRGPTVLLKGATDLVGLPNEEVLEFLEKGCPRRSGGFGDVLAGTLGTLVAWLRIRQGGTGPLDLGQAAGAASTLVRRSCNFAFQRHFRATTAPNVLDELGPAFQSISPAV